MSVKGEQAGGFPGVLDFLFELAISGLNLSPGSRVRMAQRHPHLVVRVHRKHQLAVALPDNL